MDAPTPPGAGERPLFSVTSAVDDGRCIVRIAGELDGEGLGELTTLVAEAGGPAGDVVDLDLDEVSFMSSSGLRALVQAGQGVESAGKRVRVVAASHIVTRLLEITTLDEYFGLGRTEVD